MRTILIFSMLLVVLNLGIAEEIDEDKSIEDSIANNLDIIQNYDENDDGEISSTELDTASNDFNEGIITSDQLGDVAVVHRYDGDYREHINENDLEGNVIRADMADEIEVKEGDEVFFNDGEESFEIQSFSEPSNSKIVNIIPEGNVDTGVTDRIGIPQDSFMDLGFESGDYEIHAENIDGDLNSGEIEIRRSFSESSSFGCEDYQLSENQYAFCTNQGEQAIEEIDLGHTTESINLVRNNIIVGERYATRGFYSLFVNTGSGQTIQFWNQEDSTYKGADIEIIEWRGLTDEHDGENQQVIIEVDPVAEPDAAIDFGKQSYETGEEVKLDFEAFEPGSYKLEVSGAGTELSRSYGEEDDTEDSVTINPFEEGEIQAELIASGAWWNPLDSDETISSTSTEVNNDIDEVNHEFGEKFTIKERETTRIEGKEFYLSTLVGRDKIGYESVLWRPSESGDTNSQLVLLQSIEDMGFRYEDEDLGRYGTVCRVDPNTNSAELIVMEDRFNPWEACDRHPNDLRGDHDYDLKDYTLGDIETVEPGEALEFGDSRVYVDDITERIDKLRIEGYKEWYENNPTAKWTLTEGFSTNDIFYEGDISSTICEVSENNAEIILEDSDTIGSTDAQWPEDWCAEVAQKEDNEIDFEASYGEVVEVAEGDTVSFEDGYAKIGSIWFDQEGMNIHPDREGDVVSTSLQPEANGENPLMWGEETKDAHLCEMRADSETVMITVVEENVDRETACNVRDVGSDSGSEVGINEISIDLNDEEEFEKYEDIEIEARVTEQVTEQGYRINVDGPNTADSESYETRTATHVFRPSDVGEYMVQIQGEKGLLEQVGALLTGEEIDVLAETSFQVIDPSIAKWKRHCQQQEYMPENTQDQINCIEQVIIPQYFEEPIGDDSEIAESLCQELLGYNYDEEQTRCVA